MNISASAIKLKPSPWMYAPRCSSSFLDGNSPMRNWCHMASVAKFSESSYCSLTAHQGISAWPIQMPVKEELTSFLKGTLEQGIFDKHIESILRTQIQECLAGPEHAYLQGLQDSLTRVEGLLQHSFEPAGSQPTSKGRCQLFRVDAHVCRCIVRSQRPFWHASEDSFLVIQVVVSVSSVRKSPTK